MPSYVLKIRQHFRPPIYTSGVVVRSDTHKHKNVYLHDKGAVVKMNQITKTTAAKPEASTRLKLNPQLGVEQS
jgi:hypothetical protein